VRSLLFGAVAAGLLLWVAAYNGYPTVYPDTGGYLYTGAFFIAVPPFRAPGYAIFTRLTALGAAPERVVVSGSGVGDEDSHKQAAVFVRGDLFKDTAAAVIFIRHRCVVVHEFRQLH
jgi:hypothetical protein